MDTENSSIFGKMYAPRSFIELCQILEKKWGSCPRVHYWRGQANIEWPIDSAAYRRLKVGRRGGKVTENMMAGYEKNLISQARHGGYGYEDGRRLTDFEVLAKLQHHGAATRFIDFSRNMLVALWFACSSKENATGLLIGLDRLHVSGGEGQNEERMYDNIFSTKSDINKAITWQPPIVTKRIAAQRAQFVYSAVSKSRFGSLYFDDNPESYIFIALRPAFKRMMLEQLKSTFDIHHEALHPDIDGFCASNSTDQDRFNYERS
ncbi:FRG domain-containing protein [Candidatus Symbiopectobacterium sp. NZEC135]|uniref:FRG domain-containing protein n=1 Tax=Candidatus Symbiopectobacterium sp. NZEC135 TaxID=2820471 RepID=UPI002226B89B|nr:FRG domain-containing protein [Candidatus Symbiopectobacterium sp. NZEC135]MCW2479976.1 FRG domain-containing protein [Candidatus Symbiopectobacterium sp. NZEC135]